MSSSLTNSMLNFVPTPMTLRRRPPTVTCCPTALSPPKSRCLSLNPRTHTDDFSRTSLARLATLDAHEGGGDAVDVDAARDRAGGDYATRFSDRADGRDHVAVVEVFRVFDAQATRQ